MQYYDVVKSRQKLSFFVFIQMKTEDKKDKICKISIHAGRVEIRDFAWVYLWMDVDSFIFVYGGFSHQLI